AFASPEPVTRGREAVVLDEHIVEVISDSGEGAQRCGQSLAAIAARMGTGIRIRMGAGPVTNGGDETDLVVAFNEQVLIGRVSAGELKPGAQILLESMWREHRDPKIVESYVETVKMLNEGGYKVYELPL